MQNIIPAQQDNIDPPPHASDAGARRDERDLRIAARHVRAARTSRVAYASANPQQPTQRPNASSDNHDSCPSQNRLGINGKSTDAAKSNGDTATASTSPSLPDLEEGGNIQLPPSQNKSTPTHTFVLDFAENLSLPRFDSHHVNSPLHDVYQFDFARNENTNVENGNNEGD